MAGIWLRALPGFPEAGNDYPASELRLRWDSLPESAARDSAFDDEGAADVEETQRQASAEYRTGG